MLLLLPALLCVSIASAQKDRPSYLELFRQGDCALQAGAPEVAADSFRACLELEPESPVAAFYLACATARAGELERALEALERAFTNGHGDPDFAAREPDLESLRELPRFQRLLAARLRIGRTHRPLKSLVSVLHDPKRVRAAAAGERLIPPRFVK